jgi:hypothetical protein
LALAFPVVQWEGGKEEEKQSLIAWQNLEEKLRMLQKMMAASLIFLCHFLIVCETVLDEFPVDEDLVDCHMENEELCRPTSNAEDGSEVQGCQMMLHDDATNYI